MKSDKLFFLITCLALTVAILAACAPAAEAPGAPAAGTSEPVQVTPVISTAVSAGPVESAPLASIPTSTPRLAEIVNGMLVVTRDNAGEAILLSPGERFILSLGSGYTWDISVSPDGVVRLTPEKPPEGAQGIYQAVAPGQALLSASGDPLCQSETPACMMPSILFEIKIVVE